MDGWMVHHHVKTTATDKQPAGLKGVQAVGHKWCKLTPIAKG